MINGDIAICINDQTANKMWKGDIVEVIDASQKKYRGLEGHNVGELFWCIGEVEVLPEEHAKKFK